MTKYKKDYPLSLLQTMEILSKEKSELFHIVDAGESILKFKDSDPKSDFYFEINKYEHKEGKIILTVTMKPHGRDHMHNAQRQLTLTQLTSLFDTWKNILAEFEKVNFFNDPIQKGYEEEFYSDFKIVDEDADEKSFSYGQQKQLTAYIESIVQGLDKFKTESNSVLIEELKKDAEVISIELTGKTKNETIKSLSKLWAKARRNGMKLSEFMIKEFAKEFLKEGAKSLFNFAKSNAHRIPEYLQHYMIAISN